MANSFPTFGITRKRGFISAADTTDAGPTGTKATVLATAPNRSPFSLHLADANASQQNAVSMTSQRPIIYAYSGKPAPSAPQNAVRDYPWTTTSSKSEQKDGDNSSDSNTDGHLSSVKPHVSEKDVPDTHATDTLSSDKLTQTPLGHPSQPDQELDQCFKQLAIAKELFGAEHAAVGTLHNNIGLLLKNQGKHGQAMEHYLKALAIKEKLPGADQVSIATTYSNIGSLLNDMGKPEQAMDYHLKALAIEEKVLGTSHSDTILSYGNIFSTLHQQGKHHQSIEYFKKAFSNPSTPKGAHAAT